jgi:hypothetical protein
MTGVMAALTTVPPGQKNEVTTAAVPEARAAITSIWIERPSVAAPEVCSRV